MRKFVVAAMLVLVVLLPLTGRAQEDEQDVKGGQDHPLLSRMPGFFLEQYEVKDFDSFDTAYLSGPAARWEGKTTMLRYKIKTGTKSVSMTQIALNAEAALKKIGAVKLYSEGRVVGMKLAKGAGWVHVEAYNEGTSYTVQLVEAKAMDQEMVADAEALKAGLSAEGKVAIYGIFFDTGKSEVKAESAPTLEQIVKLLKQSPKLNLFVIGHTDGVGTAEANLKLSADRAASVVRALTGKGIDAARLKASGVGPYCPVSTNRTDAGKAKNRRVELVERI